MKKIKLFIASMLGAIALVFACVLGTKVNAAQTIYTVTADEVATTADLEIKSGSSGATKSLDSYKFSNFFTFENKWGTHSGSRSYSNYADSSTIEDFEVSLKAGSARTFTLDISSDLGDGTAYVYAYGVANTSLTIGGGTASAFTKDDSPAVYTGTVNATDNTIVAGKSCCINKIVVVFGSDEPEPTAVTCTPLIQEAVVSDSTFVRFVFIVSNDTTLASSDFVDKLTLILDEGEDAEQTVTRSPNAYNKLLSGGDTYVATVNNASYTFDNSVNTNDIYVVYVVEFTTAKYIGHNVKASLNVGGSDYKTSGYTFE